jgi:hypothetical protein
VYGLRNNYTGKDRKTPGNRSETHTTVVINERSFHIDAMKLPEHL